MISDSIEILASRPGQKTTHDKKRKSMMPKREVMTMSGTSTLTSPQKLMETNSSMASGVGKQVKSNKSNGNLL